MTSSDHRRPYLTRTVVLALSAVVTLGHARDATAQETLTALPNLSVSTTTGEKPQSKLWFHAGHWWAVLPSTSVSPSGTWLWRLGSNNAWTNVLRLSSSTSAKADAKSFGDVTHVLLHASTSQLASIEYAPAMDTYVPWSVRPGLTSLSLSGSETATLDVDTTGRLWVSTENGSKLNVYYSDYPYTSFAGPITLASNIHDDDIGFVVALPFPLPSKIAVFWSNQVTKRFGFRTHIDTNPPTIWTADELPASQSALNVGGGMADDHMNGAVASDGTLYVSVKTSYNSSSQPLMALLVRRPNGTWDNIYNVEKGTGTRPIVVLNEDLGFVRVLYTASTSGGNIYYRDSPLSPIVFGARKTAISASVNNATSTKDNWSDQLVVMAAGRGVLFRQPSVVPTTSSSSTSSTSSTSTTSSSTTSAPGSTNPSTTTVTSSTTSTTVGLNATGRVSQDVSVVIGSSTRFGTAAKLEVDNEPVKHTYLQLTVSGTNGHPVTSAILTLTVASSSGADSDTRGRIHAAACGWNEATLSGTTNPQPAITAAVLHAPTGAANPGDKVAFNVTGAITGGDGTYCVALDSTITDGIDYVSKEGSGSANRPSLAITVSP